MKRSVQNHIRLSRLLVCLLIAGLAVQWMTNAVGMGSRGGIAVASTLDNTADRILIDLVASICAKDADKGTEIKPGHCQHCVPAAFQFLAAPESEAVLRLTLSEPIEAPFRSQILPASRRQPGDGPSRAPPSLA